VRLQKAKSELFLGFVFLLFNKKDEKFIPKSEAKSGSPGERLQIKENPRFKRGFSYLRTLFLF